MTSTAEFADALEELADYLEATDVAYKPQMYRTAAANLRDHPDTLERLVTEERVSEVEGVGESIAEKAHEFLDRGTFDALEREREELPVEMEALTAVEGIGPKRVKALYDALGIQDLDELAAAGEAGEIAEVEGFGATMESKIMDSIAFARQAQERSLLDTARPVADAVVRYLSDVDAVSRCTACGSLRRWQETIGDVDVLAASEEPGTVIDAFTEWDAATTVIESGANKAGIRANNLRVDLRVIDPTEYGAALQYFTGSREHNIKLRSYALDKEMKINEYGVFDIADVDDPDAGQRVGERIAGDTEQSVYETLEMEWIPPELREDTGEIDAALENGLPDLVTVNAIQGDLHTHTTWSDGRASIEEMVAAAEEFGHQFIAITDHADGPGTVADTGLDDDTLQDQMTEIHRIDEESDITVLAGVEANIRPDGSVGDTDPGLLSELDLVIASPHSGLSGEEDATERLCSAIRTDEVDILGHPSGRLLNERPGMEFDVDAVVDAAVDAGTALEVNANPQRLDLHGRAVHRAVDAGAQIVVNTDAHGTDSYDYLAYGVHTARRGWAESPDVLNTNDVESVRSFLN